jgi:HicB family
MITRVARVNYTIPDDLHRKAKAAAALHGVTLRDYVIQVLQEGVDRDLRLEADPERGKSPRATEEK